MAFQQYIWDVRALRFMEQSETEYRSSERSRKQLPFTSGYKYEQCPQSSLSLEINPTLFIVLDCHRPTSR
jgi:hypothetical protein